MQKNSQIKFSGQLILILLMAGCGVKGKPTLPAEPPRIGAGEKLPLVQKLKAEEEAKKKNQKNKDLESNP